MDSAVIAAIVSGGAAILVCVINNIVVYKKTAKVNQDNIVLISYRLEQLEKKVDKHNNLIDRTYELEKKVDLHSEKISVANHRIDDLEQHDDGKRIGLQRQ